MTRWKRRRIRSSSVRACRSVRHLTRFVDRFPYAETDDQDRAIGDVLADIKLVLMPNFVMKAGKIYKQP